MMAVSHCILIVERTNGTRRPNDLSCTSLLTYCLWLDSTSYHVNNCIVKDHRTAAFLHQLLHDDDWLIARGGLIQVQRSSYTRGLIVYKTIILLLLKYLHHRCDQIGWTTTARLLLAGGTFHRSRTRVLPAQGVEKGTIVTSNCCEHYDLPIQTTDIDVHFM